MTRRLDGPRRPARSGTARSLVILLHGYGASGDDLIDLADMMAGALPHTAFASPHACETMPYPGQPAYQWFPLTELDPDALLAGTQAAAPVLNDFIGQEAVRLGLAPHRVALAGFSQGAMMALEVGLRGPAALAAVVGLSGVVAGPSTLGQGVTHRPPVMLSHGTADEVIPFAALHVTREALAAANVPVEWHVQAGLGHGIDETTIALTASFLAQHLA